MFMCKRCLNFKIMWIMADGAWQDDSLWFLTKWSYQCQNRGCLLLKMSQSSTETPADSCQQCWALVNWTKGLELSCSWVPGPESWVCRQTQAASWEPHITPAYTTPFKPHSHTPEEQAQAAEQFKNISLPMAAIFSQCPSQLWTSRHAFFHYPSS